jgi:hypothetical protein
VRDVSCPLSTRGGGRRSSPSTRATRASSSSRSPRRAPHPPPRAPPCAPHAAGDALRVDQAIGELVARGGASRGGACRHAGHAEDGSCRGWIMPRMVPDSETPFPCMTLEPFLAADPVRAAPRVPARARRAAPLVRPPARSHRTKRRPCAPHGPARGLGRPPLSY